MAETQPENAAQSRVQKILDELTASGQELGIQVAAYLDGELVVDAYAGIADVDSARPVTGDTLMPVWSVAKGVAAALVAVLVDKGLLDYDDLVGKYWPEFASRGKELTTIGHVLSHSAGVPQLRPDITRDEILDVPTVAAWLAEQEPLWAPGTASGYHGWTYGILLAEILPRATGRTCDELLRDELAAPLGVADSLLFSIPDELLPRLATCYDGDWTAGMEAMPADSTFAICAPRGVLPIADFANRADFRRTALPANGIMTARAVARMYAALAGGEIDGLRLVSEHTLARAIEPRIFDTDRIFGIPLAKSHGFFFPDSLGSAEHSPGECFGTNGSGGNSASADPAHRFSFALAKNRMSANGQDQRLLGEIRSALGIAAN